MTQISRGNFFRGFFSFSMWFRPRFPLLFLVIPQKFRVNFLLPNYPFSTSSSIFPIPLLVPRWRVSIISLYLPDTDFP